MADIKTSLRELSVAAQIGLLMDGEKTDLVNSTPTNFYAIASKSIQNNISSAEQITRLKQFDDIQKDIIKNGVLLGTKLFNDSHFKIKKGDPIKWVGTDTQKANPADIIVGAYRLSLKEDSYILKNMGLYKYLSLMTGNTYNRGLHVFNDFAPKEYNDWFMYSWNTLLQNPDWTTINNKSSSFSLIKQEGSNIILDCSNFESKVPINITTVTEFQNNTNSHTREKVYSKWISEKLQNDPDYLKLKKECAEVAGDNICKTIKKKTNSLGIGELLQFCDEDYYYAKSDGRSVTILYVPSIKHYNKTISFLDVKSSIPKSQLNIETSFINEITKKTFTIRNECRFSHGQFNGTPEAKMYCPRNEDLSLIYTPLNLL